MKRIALAAALAVSLAPAAHAAPNDPWIVITVGDQLPDTPAIRKALISTDHYPTEAGCWYRSA
jgi:hypothetical protein